MLIDDPEARASLRQIVNTFTTDPQLREDLAQEAYLHLWRREAAHPGQSPTWYLQSCRFHLQNFLRKGRSVDCGRYRSALRLAAEPDGEWDVSAGGPAAENPVLTAVCARDFIAELSKWLTPREAEVLSCLADGWGMRETAQRLKLSHTSVIKHRKRIAALAVRLGMTPPLNRNGHGAASGKAGARRAS